MHHKRDSYIDKLIDLYPHNIHPNLGLPFPPQIDLPMECLFLFLVHTHIISGIPPTATLTPSYSIHPIQIRDVHIHHINTKRSFLSCKHKSDDKQCPNIEFKERSLFPLSHTDYHPICCLFRTSHSCAVLGKEYGHAS